MITIELGNVGSQERVDKIIKALDGKTCYNFHVQYSPMFGNYPVSIISFDTSEEGRDEMKDMIIYVLACSL